MPDAIKLLSTPPAPDAQRTANLKEAAGQFEALLIGQMLKSARQTDSGGWTGDADQAGSSILDMADQHLAEMLGKQGALGIARLIVDQVEWTPRSAAGPPAGLPEKPPTS